MSSQSLLQFQEEWRLLAVKKPIQVVMVSQSYSSMSSQSFAQFQEERRLLALKKAIHIPFAQFQEERRLLALKKADPIWHCCSIRVLFPITMESKRNGKSLTVKKPLLLVFSSGVLFLFLLRKINGQNTGG